jgi:hypothetical protein
MGAGGVHHNSPSWEVSWPGWVPHLAPLGLAQHSLWIVFCLHCLLENVIPCQFLEFLLVDLSLCLHHRLLAECNAANTIDRQAAHTK